MDLHDKGVIDIGCSRHMTGNMSYLTDYKEIDRGYVAFGGKPKGGKIIGKSTIRTGKLDFENVYFAEAVKTACYVQNRVCPDEGFIVRYSLSSKAFKVFNSRKRIVEENLHIRFSENTPDVVGSGPDLLFDIDALTRIMNYEPIVVGTQSNGFVGTKACDNVGKARKEKEHVKDFIFLPLWTADPSFSQDPKSSQDDGFQPLSNSGKNVDDDLSKARKEKEHVKDFIFLPLWTADPLFSQDPKSSQDDGFQPLKDISTFNFSSDHEDDDEEADMNNMDTTIQIDVKSVFLYGKIKEEVYVCQPLGFEDPDFPDKVGKINKTLFIRRHKVDILLAQVYMDDIIFGSTKKELCIAFEKMMHEKFQMSSMGELTFFLGLQVKQKQDGIFISQD
nr:putative ribonuclease H-like domain-containing protein [Tanacetum cinerariifolium]